MIVIRLFELNSPNIENHRVNQEKREKSDGEIENGHSWPETRDWKINVQNWLLKILTKKGYLSVYTVSREPNPKEVPQIRSRNKKKYTWLKFLLHL